MDKLQGSANESQIQPRLLRGEGGVYRTENMQVRPTERQTSGRLADHFVWNKIEHPLDDLKGGGQESGIKPPPWMV